MQRAAAMHEETGWLNWISHGLAGVSFMAVFGLVPVVLGVVATSLAILWYGIQLHENATVKAFFRRRRQRKLDKLQAQIDALRDKNPPDV